MLGPLGSPNTVISVQRFDRSDDLARLRRHTTLTYDGYRDECELELCFAVTASGRDEGDRGVGINPGNWAEAECVGAVLSLYGEVALTREQVVELIGADWLAEAERRAAERYADGMRG